LGHGIGSVRALSRDRHRPAKHEIVAADEELRHVRRTLLTVLLAGRHDTPGLPAYFVDGVVAGARDVEPRAVGMACQSEPRVIEHERVDDAPRLDVDGADRRLEVAGAGDEQRAAVT